MKSKVKSQKSEVKVQRFKRADFAFKFGLSIVLLIFDF